MVVFAEMAGLPKEDYDRFQEWVERTMYGRTDDPEDAVAASKEVYAYFRALRLERLAEPERDDLIGCLLAGRIDGRALSADEFADYCFLLLVAGLETSAWSIRAALWHLAQHPEDRRRLVAEPELLVKATEEFLRCLTPVQGMARTLQEDVEIRGQVIEAGERVLLLLGSGNRDEEVFADADTVVIDRGDNPHLAFGIGSHRCLGSNLGPTGGATRARDPAPAHTRVRARRRRHPLVGRRARSCSAAALPASPPASETVAASRDGDEAVR